jgi:single-strand DNA-binding protein
VTGTLNKVTLIGRLGKDPEIRYTPSGSKFATIVVATSEQWKDKNGQKAERTEWHRVSVWNESLSDLLERYTRKGSKIYLEGTLQSRKFQDRDGKDVYSREIVVPKVRGVITLLDRVPSQGGSAEGEDLPNNSTDPDYTPSIQEDLGDCIPF